MPSARSLARAQADSGASALIATAVTSAKTKSYQPRSSLISRTAASLQSGSYLIEEHEQREE